MTRTIYHEIAGVKTPLVQFDTPDQKVAYDVHLRTALNDSGQLSLTIPPSNAEAMHLSQMVSEVSICEANDIWTGRVTDISVDDNECVAVTVKGLLDYLYDTVLPPISINGTAQHVMQTILNYHNEKSIEINKKFELGTVNISGTVELKVSQSTKTWDVLKSMISKYNGYISAYRDPQTGANIIDWVENLSRVCTQDIRPGLNMIKLSDERSASGICTVLYGYGKKQGDNIVSLSAVNNGSDYVIDEDALAEYGWIEDVYVDNDCESAQQLLQQTRSELAKRLSEIRTVSIQTIDLADLEDNVERFSVGCLGHVVFPGRGIEDTMPIKSIDWYPFAPDKTQITLGASLKLISMLKGG